MTGVASDDLVTIGDPRLKGPTEHITDVNDVSPLLERMVERLRELNGAGLAAPQLGAAVRVIVVEVRKTDVFPDRPISPLLKMVNPCVVYNSRRTALGWEGCFSVPGLMGLVPRPQEITVEYVTQAGARVEEQYSGYVARVIQHEIDHLDGVEFIDRMTSMDSLTTVANFLEFHRDS